MDQEKKLSGGKIALGACGGCIVLIIVGAIILFLMVSKTGLIGNKTPDAEPTRVVDATKVNLDQVEVDLTSQILRALGGGDVEVRITEEMITAFMRDNLGAEAQQEGIDIARTQVAILEEGSLEIFMPLDVNGKATSLTITVAPSISDGSLKMDVVQVRLGTLKAPGFLTDIPEGLINDAIAEQLAQLDEKITLTALDFESGALTLTGSVNIDQIIK